MEELKKINIDQRKVNNELKTSEAKLKFELTEKTEDLEEAQ